MIPRLVIQFALMRCRMIKGTHLRLCQREGRAKKKKKNQQYCYNPLQSEAQLGCMAENDNGSVTIRDKREKWPLCFYWGEQVIQH